MKLVPSCAGVLTAAATLAVLGAPAAVSAQLEQRGDLSIEARGGFVMPTEDFSDGFPELAPNPGVTTGGSIMLRVTPQISVYGGGSWSRFDCNGELCFGTSHFTTWGPDAGLKLILPTRGTVTPWIRGGALYHRLEIRTAGISVSSDRSIGLDSAIGVDIALGARASLTPALRYGRYGVEVGIGEIGVVEEITVSWGAIDLAIHLLF
jgi:hypothetical protein